MQKLFKEVISNRSVWRGPFSLVTFLFRTAKEKTFIRPFKVTHPPLGGLGWVFHPLGGLGWVFHPLFTGRDGKGSQLCTTSQRWEDNTSQTLQRGMHADDSSHCCKVKKTYGTVCVHCTSNRINGVSHPNSTNW